MEEIDYTALPTPAQANRIAEWLARGGYRVIRPLMKRSAYCEDAPPDNLVKVAILDTETTGLDHETDRIIELGIVIVEVCPTTGLAYRIVETFSELEDPGFSMSEEISRIHGITDEMVKGKRINDALVDELVSDVDLVIAHNADFDRQFVERRFPVFAGKPWACSVTQIPWRKEGIGSAKQQFLAYFFGFSYDGHRAINDCQALLEILQQPLPQSGRLAMRVLLENNRTNEIRLFALASPLESKDVLKARNYRWNAERNVWHTTIPEERLAEEIAWLRKEVYRGDNFRLEQESMNTLNRYSLRRGTVEIVSYT